MLMLGISQSLVTDVALSATTGRETLSMSLDTVNPAIAIFGITSTALDGSTELAELENITPQLLI